MAEKQDDTGGAGVARPRSEGGAKHERTARLEQALRANLRRRKAQSRARADVAPPADGGGKDR